MDIQETIGKAQDAISVKRVYGEPYERDGVVLIPAAEVRGGGGGGGGSDPAKKSSGSGGGYGINARPVGAYVIEGGRVRWEPVVDVTAIAVRAMVTAVGLALLLRRRLG
ncbi:MAG: spore germination protein GerW family protein [Solirubrobacterales bacterium]